MSPHPLVPSLRQRKDALPVSTGSKETTEERKSVLAALGRDSPPVDRHPTPNGGALPTRDASRSFTAPPRAAARGSFRNTGPGDGVSSGGVADEWYRTPDWSAEAREEFERRLQRARPYNQSQYLRIKAGSLQAHGGDAERRGARELYERVLRDYPDAFALDTLPSLLGLATLAEEDGATDEAIDRLRAAVDVADAGNVRGDQHLRLAELLIRSEDPERWTEAGTVLDRVIDPDLAFSKNRFRFAVLRARLAAREGDGAAAASFAKAALAETARARPDFSRHSDLGWANADPDIAAEMQALAGA
jgi:hypothetical protein